MQQQHLHRALCLAHQQQMLWLQLVLLLRQAVQMQKVPARLLEWLLQQDTHVKASRHFLQAPQQQQLVNKMHKLLRHCIRAQGLQQQQQVMIQHVIAWEAMRTLP